MRRDGHPAPPEHPAQRALDREAADAVHGERGVHRAGLADDHVEALGDRGRRLGLGLDRRRELRDGFEPSGVAGVGLAEVLDLAPLRRERRPRGALAVALEAEHGDERRGARTGREAEQRRARDVARVPAPRRVVRLDRPGVRREEPQQRVLARRPRERRHRLGELVAGQRRVRDGAQRRVDVLDPDRRGAGQRDDGHRQLVDQRGERLGGGRRRDGRRGRARDRLRQRDAGRRGVPHGHDAGDVLDPVAPRSLRHPARDGEPVAALPGPQSLPRDPGELREAGRADRLTIFARHIPRTEMMPHPP